MENPRSSINKQVDSSGGIDREITNMDAPYQVNNQSAPHSASDIFRKAPIHLPNEILDLMWSYTDVVEPRNVTVTCKKVGESFELWSNEPYSIELRVCRQSRQWFKDQYRNERRNVASLAQIGGYVGPLKPLKNLCDEAFITMCNVMQAAKVVRIASDINENRQLKLVEWKEGNTKLDMLQEKRRRIQTNYKALPTFKKISEAYADQSVADAKAKLEDYIARKVRNLPIWLYQNKEEWEGLKLQIMVEAGTLDRQEKYLGNESSDSDDGNDDRECGYAHSKNVDEETSEEDEDEEPEEDESITDENSDYDTEN
ncbi:uncharacterized protein EAE97_004602 [Botrytis byssoidea]|uniref:Uncharacterized protein n=1 Tax=Botrytis byssoidea TaxID=139641 RepID=A0A9P5IUD2_9HELO|nr:uncharacterized protein EAE97_004602 [Botrytis byssoidea]KAF7947353.1 hypothetical protein EAE97_004602 [Botrytis byssoidea]